MRHALYIPTYRRSTSIGSHPLIEQAYLCVRPDELAVYQQALTKAGRSPLGYVHPHAPGISAARNACLDHGRADNVDVVLMSDDDVDGVRFVTDSSKRLFGDPDDVMAALLSTAYLAYGLGAGAFGFTISSAARADISTVCGLRPLRLRSRIDAKLCGVLSNRIRFDETLAHGEDIDMTLQSVLYTGMALCEARYVPKSDNYRPGGLSELRNATIINECYLRLQRKWGAKVIELRQGAGNTGTGIVVHL